MSDEMEKRVERWRKTLTELQFRVTREAHTERPFTGEYWNHFEGGRYRCICCEQLLFESDSKFDAGCGWPSFDQAVSSGAVAEREDHSFGMRRVEVVCSSCDAHLGHVFPDGPTLTGLRYCINSAAIVFEPNGE